MDEDNMVECEDCYGEGTIELSHADPAKETRRVKCDTCKGQGKYEDCGGPSDARMDAIMERHWDAEERFRQEMEDAGRGHLVRK